MPCKPLVSGVPRTIRSRTGQTEDPVPEGKHVAEHKCVFSDDIVLRHAALDQMTLHGCISMQTYLQEHSHLSPLFVSLLLPAAVQHAMQLIQLHRMHLS
jgi:hypothetical protein